MSADHDKHLQDVTKIHTVYSYAYGYLNSLVSEYVGNHISVGELYLEHLNLSKSVASACERIISDIAGKVRDVGGDDPQVYVTDDADQAHQIKEEHPDTVILDLR